MDLDNLVLMANRIGQFFEAMPDRQEAIDGISGHIRKFWEPRMRHELRDAIASGRAEGLRPLVAEALAARPEGLA